MCKQLLAEGHNQHAIAKVNLAVGQTILSTQPIPAALPQATVKKGLRPKNFVLRFETCRGVFVQRTPRLRRWERQKIRKADRGNSALSIPYSQLPSRTPTNQSR